MSDSSQPAGDRIEPLLTAGAIAGRVGRLGRDLTAFYADRQPLTVLGVMTGGLVFCGDLIRKIEQPLQLGVIHARSYHGRSTTSGELSLAADMLPPIEDRHVLLVDDIFDSGRTLSRIVDELASRQPASIESVVLLNKQVERAAEATTQPTWSGFEIADEFVVGYGLDFDGEHRNLPAIGVLKRGE